MNENNKVLWGKISPILDRMATESLSEEATPWEMNIKKQPVRQRVRRRIFPGGSMCKGPVAGKSLLWMQQWGWS